MILICDGRSLENDVESSNAEWSESMQGVQVSAEYHTYYGNTNKHKLIQTRCLGGAEGLSFAPCA